MVIGGRSVGLAAVEVAALVLFMLACLTGTAAGGALDDVQGYRDGIDQQTYTENARGGFQAKNNRSIKPIVNGEISVGEAHRFGIAIALASFALGSLAITIAPDAPSWLIGVWAVWAFACTQYGYGSKVSYYGGAELLLGLVIATIVWIPVVMLDGELSRTVVFQAYLIGTLLSQVTLFSMVYDKAVDAAAGRRTLAVRLSLRGYKVAVVAWFASGWAVAVTGFAVGAARRLGATGVAARVRTAGLAVGPGPLSRRSAERAPGRLARLRRGVRDVHRRQPPDELRAPQSRIRVGNGISGALRCVVARERDGHPLARRGPMRDRRRSSGTRTPRCPAARRVAEARERRDVAQRAGLRVAAVLGGGAAHPGRDGAVAADHGQ